MEIGTAGIPVDLAESRDWNLIFSGLADAGISVFYPCSIYEEIPVVRGLGYEADFVPPPFGTATSEIYDIARAHGITISFSANVLFPLDGSGIDPANSPLQAIINAGGADIIHSIVNYDEPAFNGLDPELSRAVYEHVKSIDPNIQVIQVHAPVTGDTPQDYLAAVLEHAQWSDVVGFAVYPIGAMLGERTPQRPDQLVPPAEALQDYMDWLQSELGDHQHIMVLQGFAPADHFSAEALAGFSPEELETSRAPTIIEMRQMLSAVSDADMIFWWGPGLLSSAMGAVWQNILSASGSLMNDGPGTPMGALEDVDTTVNAIDEDVGAGATVGITLFAHDPDAVDVVSYSLFDNRFQVDAGGNVTIAAGATFDFETEPRLMVEGTATSTDGTVSRVIFEIDVRDVIDQVHGTAGDDFLLGGEGSDLINAGSGDDLVIAFGGDDEIDAGRGNDQVYGGAGDDTIRGQAGDDVLIGEAGDDHVEGGDGNDIVLGLDGNDRIDGGAGDDTISGGAGDDTIKGQDGNDVIAAETGNNQIEGGNGDDVLYGGDGNDRLDGGAGIDFILAGDGDNIIMGGTGDDQMLAGTGADRFVFRSGDGTDLIYAFDVENDTLVFDGPAQTSDLSISYFGTSAVIEYDGGYVVLVEALITGSETFNFDFL